MPVTTLPANLQTWKNNHHIPNTDIDLYETKTVKEGDNDVTQYIYRLSHTKGGNVFAGGMGRQKTLDGADISGISWEKLGCVKQTKLTITGGKIKSNVYGGGELGAVIPAHNTTEGGNTEISISGAAVIGSEITEKVNDADVVRYTFGSVYGGGMGSEAKATTEDLIGGRVEGSTKISMTAGTVKASVYGGGELAVVKGGQAAKDIAGNDIKDSDNNAIDFGTDISISGTAKVGYNQDGFGGATMGNIYGGGKGSLTTAKAGLIKKNTLVKISGTPEIYHNIYGGGAYGSVGTFTFTTGAPTWPTANGTGKAEVIIEGGTIGVNGHENGMVFGSSRGDVATPVGDPAVDPNDKLAWVYDTHVTIGNSSAGPSIRGTVYGSGENGHVFNNTVVDIHKGTIGIASGSKITGSSGTEYEGAAYPYRGNVYGGGCGTDMYDSDGDGTEDTYNPLAGIVLGNTNITMDGGTVVHNIYGAGAMGSVGTKDNTGAITSGGTTTIAISSGNVGVDGTKGDGNIFGAARGDETSTQAGVALVKTTDVTISGNATVWGSVYGGGEVGSVGSFNERFADGKYIWTSDTENLNGLSKVTITGGETKGHVFGAGKGKANNFKCDKAMVRETQVSVSNGTVNGNVYGGGEIGRVEEDTEVKIGVAPEGGSGTYEPTIKSSVFGGGAGLETHGYSALVRGNATVIVEGGAKIGHSVYGGGEIASVGRYGLDEHKMPEILLDGGYCYVKVKGSATVGTGSTGGDVFGACKGVTPHLEDMDDTDRSKRPRRMTMYKDADFPETAKLSDTGTPTPNNGTIWEYYDKTAGLVWEYFRTEEAYDKYLQTLALATHPEVTIDGGATVNGSVYGGGEMGLTKGSVYVNILSGTITKDVYGGGALANTNTTSTKGVIGENDIPEKDGDNYVTTTVSPKPTVNLLGGSMRDAYGGGLGQLARDEVEAKDAVPAQGTEGEEGYVPAQPAIEHQDALPAIEAKVFGDVKVNLNGLNASTDIAATTLTALTEAGKLEANGSGYRVKTTGVKGAIVNRVFGCNNLNGTPLKKVQVYVHATQNKAKTSISDDKTEENRHTGFEAEDAETTYDVKAVYGGGNLAAYVPADPDKTTTLNETTEKAEVYIDGCDYTSIKTVYGGGNAASAPATCVTINGNYEIEEVFGGGNGKDKITINGVLLDNPGANVGFHAYVDNVEGDTDTPENRAANYGYGTGADNVNINGGRIHRVYGGSNTKGNVRQIAVTMLEEVGGCDFKVDEAYGGGKSATMDGQSRLEMACIPGLKNADGGAENADINNNVTLSITNGNFDRVFGGNNVSGTIHGTITVNIEETGCHLITIGQLYGGGNQAPYLGPLKPGSSTERQGPTLNVRSFSSIGEVYGGGYGQTAIVTGDTEVNINVCAGRDFGATQATEVTRANTHTGNQTISFSEFRRNADGGFVTDEDGNRIVDAKTVDVYLPPFTTGSIGGINNVYGGGNAAKVVGSTYVNIGTTTGDNVVFATPPADSESERTHVVKGANITGNVYGGGNAAEVTGDTHVQIGKKIVTE